MLKGSESLHPFPCTLVNRMFVSQFSIRPLIVVLLLAVGSFSGSIAEACPFCNAVSQTLRQEMGSMDAVPSMGSVDSVESMHYMQSMHSMDYM